MSILGKTRKTLSRIAQDAGFLFSAGTLGVILSATERYGISDAPLTSPLTIGAAAATLTSAFFAARNFNPAHSMIANAAMLFSGSAFLLFTGGGSAFLIPAAMMLSLGTASALKAFEIFTGKKTPFLNSEAFVGLGGMGVAYTMGGGPAAFMAALMAGAGLYFSLRGQNKTTSEFFKNAIYSRACFMVINLISSGFALGKSEDLLDLKTLSGSIGPAFLLLGNAAILRINRANWQNALEREMQAASATPALTKA